MKIVLSRKLWAVFLAVISGSYAGAYLACRQQHILVHEVTYQDTHDGRRLHDHRIFWGDPRTPHQRVYDPAPSFLWRRIAYGVFSPLRIMESVFWRFIPRDYGFDEALPNHAVERTASHLTGRVGEVERHQRMARGRSL